MHDATRSTSSPHRNSYTRHAVDNTDWLKTAAIISVAVDHFGHFFMEDDKWWSVFGRLAAPTFFFLMGYAQTRTVPLHCNRFSAPTLMLARGMSQASR